MSTAISSTVTSELASLVTVVDQAKDYARQSKAHNTWRAYAATLEDRSGAGGADHRRTLWL